MSVRKPDSDAAAVYKTMTDALNQGKRIIYNTESKKFETVSREKAKELESDQKYITLLPQLQAKVETYIKENGINPEQQTQLTTAFKSRASELKGRFILWGGDRRDKAVSELEQFPSAITKAAAEAVKILKHATLASSPGPTSIVSQPQAPTQHRETTSPKTSKNKESFGPFAEKVSASQPEQTQTSSQSGQPTQRPAVPMAEGGPPPPPPGGARGPGGPPPPPGPMKPAGSKYTQTHINLTKARSLFENERAPPKIAPGHDLGKINLIPEKDRLNYAETIEQYVKGERVETQKKTGGPKEVIYQNSLDDALKPLKKQISDDAADAELLKGKEVQLVGIKAEITQKKAHQGLMKAANQEGLVYVRQTKEKDSKSVTLQPDRVVEDTLSKLTTDELGSLKKMNVDPEKFAISHQLKLDADELEILNKEADNLTNEISNLQKKIAARHTLKNNGIPFNQWEKLIKEKEEVSTRLLALTSNLRKGTPVVEKAAPEVDTTYAAIYEKSPWLEETVTTMSTLPMGALAVLKKEPDNFFRKLN